MKRREFLARSGAIVVAFSLWRPGFAQQAGASGLGSLEKSPYLDSWIRVDPDGAITIFTGKAELGQGIKTALLQIAAEELDVPFERLKLVTADTALTPDEGFTAGSRSMQDSGTAIRNAAAQVRELLAARQPLHVEAKPESKLKDPRTHKVMGRSIPRVDIPAKVTGAPAYLHDIRLPGMLHARVILPPSYGAALDSFDARAAESMSGVVKVVRDGSFLAVVAEREWTAIKAMRALGATARWRESASLPDHRDLPRAVLGLASQDITIHDKGAGAGGTRIEATYTRPYQIHGSIGPSCAVAQMKDGGLTVWTHTQGVYPDRKAISEMLGLPAGRVRCIHAEGSGCYGHNGADDVAGDAALIAMQLGGRPVRVQWMREQEHAWEPFGPAMVGKASATLDASGRVTAFNYDVWSNTHSTRPGPAGSLIAARHISKAFTLPEPKPSTSPEGMGDRNAIPLYAFPGGRVVHHFLARMPLRVSALRALGAYLNVFAIESFMDELALAARADPVEFRLRHLEDPRGREVIRVAAEKFGWKAGARAPAGRGYGFAFARYKNHAAYCAVAFEVEVDRETGRVRPIRAVAAVDSGEVVNPDGLRNQIEGAIVQSASWTLYEQVSFDERRIRSVDWATYPILRFDAAPQTVEVHLVDRPGEPFLGSGECGQGPAAAALGNAIANATGRRLRDLPLRRNRIRESLGA